MHDAHHALEVACVNEKNCTIKITYFLYQNKMIYFGFSMKTIFQMEPILNMLFSPDLPDIAFRNYSPLLFACQKLFEL